MGRGRLGAAPHTPGQRYTDKVHAGAVGEREHVHGDGVLGEPVDELPGLLDHYCNMHDLTCGSADGCSFAKHDFAAKESLGLCLQHDATQCKGKKKEVAAVAAGQCSAGSYKCPGSKSLMHASCELDRDGAGLVLCGDGGDRGPHERRGRVGGPAQRGDVQAAEQLERGDRGVADDRVGAEHAGEEVHGQVHAGAV
eukprot:Sspe_Gene.1465::Locus_485_Transcript_5_5_Confidence_0.533_Length_631::g.1465::m.1465